jgi:hypothetical protein
MEKPPLLINNNIDNFRYMLAKKPEFIGCKYIREKIANMLKLNYKELEEYTKTAESKNIITNYCNYITPNYYKVSSNTYFLLDTIKTKPAVKRVYIRFIKSGEYHRIRKYSNLDSDMQLMPFYTDLPDEFKELIESVDLKFQQIINNHTKLIYKTDTSQNNFIEIVFEINILEEINIFTNIVLKDGKVLMISHTSDPRKEIVKTNYNYEFNKEGYAFFINQPVTCKSPRGWFFCSKNKLVHNSIKNYFGYGMEINHKHQNLPSPHYRKVLNKSQLKWLIKWGFIE